MIHTYCGSAISPDKLPDSNFEDQLPTNRDRHTVGTEDQI